MGLAKGFRFINLILLIGALVLFLITPLYYNKSSIALTVKDGNTFKYDSATIMAVDYTTAEDVDYIVLDANGEYVIINSVTKDSVNVVENDQTYTATVYNVEGTLYREGASTGTVYKFTLNDVDYERVGGIAANDKYLLSDRSVSATSLTVHEGATKYTGRDVLLKFTAVTGITLVFGNAFSTSANFYMIIVSALIAGIISVALSFFLMRKRSEILAANVVSGACALIAVMVALYYANKAVLYSQAGGVALFTLAVVVSSLTVVTSFLGNALGMKSKENALYGNVITVLGAIALVFALILGGFKGNALVPTLIVALVAGLCLMAVGIVTKLVFAKSTKNDKLNENCVEEENNTYVDPNAQQTVEE